MGKACLGIELGTDEIRVVELRRAGRKFELAQAARIPLSSAEPADAVAALEGFLLDTSTSPANVVVSVPSDACSIKFAQVPRAKPVELARMVRFDAESQLPLPLADVAWGFSSQESHEPGNLHVVIGAARRSVVDETLAALSTIHVSPRALMVAALAGAGSVAAEAFGEPVLVLDLGPTWSSLCVVDRGCVYGARSVRFGGGDLTEAMVRDYEIGVEEAEQMKQAQGIGGATTASDDHPPAGAVAAWVDRMAAEIRRSATSLAVVRSERSPCQVFVIGAGAAIPGVAGRLSRASGLPVRTADPWAGMKIGDACARTVRDLPAVYATATGLARYGLGAGNAANLMPRHIAEDRARRRGQTAALTGLGAAAAVLLVVYLAGIPVLSARSKELRDVRTQVKKVQADIRRAGPDVRVTATSVKSTISSIESNDGRPIEILRQLSENLPRSIWLTEFSYDAKKSLVLKGGALSNSAVADAVDVISQLPAIAGVTLDYSNLASADGKRDYEFRITCTTRTGKGTSAKQSAKSSREGIIVQ